MVYAHKKGVSKGALLGIKMGLWLKLNEQHRVFGRGVMRSHATKT